MGPLEIQLNGAGSGEGCVIVSSAAQPLPATFTLRTTDGSTGQVECRPSQASAASLSVSPSTANVSGMPVAVQVLASTASASLNDLTVEVVAGPDVVASFDLTALESPTVRFSGRFQCRLATDGDPFPHEWGTDLSFFRMYAVQGTSPLDPAAPTDEPPLDRVIRFQDVVGQRPLCGPIGVTITSIEAAVGGVRERFISGDPLLGLPVRLGPQSRFEEQDGAFAASTFQPIADFRIEVGSVLSGGSAPAVPRPSGNDPPGSTAPYADGAFSLDAVGPWVPADFGYPEATWQNHAQAVVANKLTQLQAEEPADARAARIRARRIEEHENSAGGLRAALTPVQRFTGQIDRELGHRPETGWCAGLPGHAARDSVLRRIFRVRHRLSNGDGDGHAGRAVASGTQARRAPASSGRGARPATRGALEGQVAVRLAVVASHRKGIVMERRYRNAMARVLEATGSRRQVLGTTARGTIGGLGAALITRGEGTNLFDDGLAPEANAQGTACQPPPNVLQRKNITALTADELASLRLGVAEMKRRSQVDPEDETGWLFQANLHALPAILDPVPTWCQHSSWYFFPWHRMYLYRLERILQDASGNPDLRLPYWNYSDDPAQRALPRALGDELDASGNPNSLYESRRAMGMNDGTVPLTAAAVVYSTAFLDIDFFPLVTGASHFGGQRIAVPAYNGPEAGSLEGTPHGNVHNEVGGSEGIIGLQPITVPATIAYHCSIHPSMTGTINVVNDPAVPSGSGFVEIVDFKFVPDNLTLRVGNGVQWINMGDTEHTITADDATFDSGPISPNGYMALLELAARDPTFWLHHANIDRLWERWLAQTDVPRSNPTGEADWMNQTFPFYDVDGTKVHMAVSDVLDTKCLGYTFDDPLTEHAFEEPAAFVGGTPVAVTAPQIATLGESPADKPIDIGAEPVSVAIALAPDAENALAMVATSAARQVPGSGRRVFDDAGGNRKYRLSRNYLGRLRSNLPPDVEPDPNSDSFVGTIYLFGLSRHAGHDMAEGGARQTFNITRAVQASRVRADSAKGVTVTVVPTGTDRIMALLATPVPEGAQPFVEAAKGPWVRVARITVLATE